MSVTAGVVAQSVAALLADPAMGMFTFAYQLPYLKMAWSTLQLELKSNDLVDVQESYAPVKTIASGVKIWSNQSTELVNMLAPIDMWERAVGATEKDWVEMAHRQPEPWEDLVRELEVWYIEEGLLKFRGANTDRQVLLKYQRELATITNESTILPVTGVDMYLAFRTAALIADSRGNKSKAQSLGSDAVAHLQTTIADKVKGQQNVGVRPKPYGHARRQRRFGRVI